MADRNLAMAGRSGVSSLTLEEEARVKLLLGPASEGDDPTLQSSSTSANDDYNNADEDRLLTNVYGGPERVKRMTEIDDKLKSMGVFDRFGVEDGSLSSPRPETDLGFEQAPPPPKQEKGEGVLRARARERAEKSKEKNVDAALEALRNAPIAVVKAEGGDGKEEDEDCVDYDDVAAALSAPVSRKDIARVLDDAMAEMRESSAESKDADDGDDLPQLAEQSEIRLLLGSMGTDIDRQRKIRDEESRKRRIEIEEVIARVGLRGEGGEDTKYDDDEEEGESKEGEPKQWAGKIGEIFQSSWEGNDSRMAALVDEGDDVGGYYDYDNDADADDNDGRGEVKGDDEEEEEKFRLAEESEDNKENDSLPSVVQQKDFFTMNMELEGAMGKAMVALERGERRAREMESSASTIIRDSVDEEAKEAKD
jgi:hypothetical protein